MAESAAHLVDHVFPEAPVRQWVLTFPFPLRFLLAAEPKVLTDVLAVVQRGISTFLIRRAGLTVSSGAKTGAVTLIQRFGSALNLNPHLHMLFLDGAYTFSGSRASFHRARRPQPDELLQLLDSLSRRIVRLLERRGLLIAEPQYPALDLDVGSALDQIQAASVQYRIAVGPHAGRKALTLCSVPPVDDKTGPNLLAHVTGFSLHAATVCEAHQRTKLERLCRYITCLAALVPRPRLNLTRFHGVFAPNCKHRSRIVPHRPRTETDASKPTAPMSWPLSHILVLRGTGTSCPMDGAAQAGVCDRY